MTKERRYPLEPTAEEMREMLEQVTERIVDHIDSLPRQPASYDSDGRLVAKEFVEPIPASGSNFGALLDRLFDDAAPHSYNTAGPGYLAYIPGGGIFPSAIADLIANAINRYVGVWVAAPALVQLELNVIRWFCEIVGYGSGSGGVLTSGGSLSNLTAIVTARRERLGDDLGNGVIYTSDQTHHSVRKSAVVAGFPESAVRQIRTDEFQQIRIDQLSAEIRSDHAAGRRPFLIVGSAGTTNTGAIDDLDGLATLAQKEELWFHIDAAYGGFFALTEHGRSAMVGLEKADSITLDPHKGLFLPYGTGALLVRDEGALRRAHATFADYMPVMQHDPDFVDFCELSAELSRDFRGLRIWLPIKLFGLEAFREALDEKLELANWITDQLRNIPEVEIVTEPRLSLVSFRMRDDRDGEATQSLMRSINARKNVYLTGTMVDGRFAIRICVLSFRTHHDRMQVCANDIRDAVAEITTSS